MNILITGGCGFIGCNAAARFATLGHRTTLLDNLSRPCTDLNLAWLQQQAQFNFVNADVRDARAVNELMREGRFDVVLHLAAQVAVTRTRWTTLACTVCAPSTSANPAFTACVSSALKTRAGLPGSPLPTSWASPSRSMAPASRCATSCSWTTWWMATSRPSNGATGWRG